MKIAHYAPWKGFALWFGSTAVALWYCGGGEKAATVCLVGFLIAWLWSMLD